MWKKEEEIFLEKKKILMSSQSDAANLLLNLCGKQSEQPVQELYSSPVRCSKKRTVKEWTSPQKITYTIAKVRRTSERSLYVTYRGADSSTISVVCKKGDTYSEFVKRLEEQL